MNERRETLFRRRDLFRAVTIGVAGVAAGAIPFAPPATPAAVSGNEKRKARYQPHSTEVQDFYRVNRYPAQ